MKNNIKLIEHLRSAINILKRFEKDSNLLVPGVYELKEIIDNLENGNLYKRIRGDRLVLLEKSCIYVKDCKFHKLKNFNETLCRGWCEDFCWDGKSIPIKPEFFTNIQLKNMLRKIPEVNSEENWNELNQKIQGLFGLSLFVAEEKKDIQLPLDVIKALQAITEQAITEDSKKDFIGTFILYVDLRTKMRAFVKSAKLLEDKD